MSLLKSKRSSCSSSSRSSSGRIRQKLGQRGIAVEVNPSSNLLIGDLSDLTKHPLWRLRPPRSSGDAPPVSVCIGSDDPLTFATKLPQEYQLLHDALVLAGLSEAEAACWLDETRETGLRNRFTLPRRLGFATAETPLKKPSIKPMTACRLRSMIKS